MDKVCTKVFGTCLINLSTLFHASKITLLTIMDLCKMDCFPLILESDFDLEFMADILLVGRDLILETPEFGRELQRLEASLLTRLSGRRDPGRDLVEGGLLSRLFKLGDPGGEAYSASSSSSSNSNSSSVGGLWTLIGILDRGYMMSKERKHCDFLHKSFPSLVA